MQIGLVFFQAAQQPLGFSDSFFQCEHGMDAASLVSTVPQQWQGASCKLGAGWGSSWDAFAGKRRNWRLDDQLGQRRVALQSISYFILQVVSQPFFKLIL